MKDFLDQEITVGDIVVYPNRQGSNLWMVLATVLEVREDSNSLRIRRSDGTVKTITRVDRVTVVRENDPAFETPVLEPVVA